MYYMCLLYTYTNVFPFTLCTLPDFYNRGHRGRARMVVVFTTTYAINVYHQ